MTNTYRFVYIQKRIEETDNKKNTIIYFKLHLRNVTVGNLRQEQHYFQV